MRGSAIVGGGEDEVVAVGEELEDDRAFLPGLAPAGGANPATEATTIPRAMTSKET
jgi:hypothetical protein